MINSTTVQFFQTSGAQETIDATREEFLKKHPGAKVLSVEFDALYPGNREGRWCDMKVTYEK